MEHQNTFFSALTEDQIFDIIKDTLFEVIAKNNASSDKLLLKSGLSYSSVWYSTQMAFRICCRNGHNYFGVSNAYVDFASSDFQKHITKDGRCDGFTNYAFTPTVDGIIAFSPFLEQILDKTIDSIPKEFDCCSRYMECSNAKYCINPNPNIATGCGYRKILKSGKIYYGENRNID